MNLLTVIILLIIFLYAVRGYRNGFVQTLTAMLMLGLTLVLVYWLSPYVEDFLRESTPVYSYVEEQCEALVGGQNADAVSDESAQTAYIEKLNLPEVLKEQLIKNNTAPNYAKLAVNSFKQYLARFLANVILKLFVCIVTFLVVRLLLTLAVELLGLLTRLPLIHGVNKLLGGALGLGQGVVMVWIGFLVLTLLTGTQLGRDLLNMIYESEILCRLYDSNVFLNLLLR